MLRVHTRVKFREICGLLRLTAFNSPSAIRWGLKPGYCVDQRKAKWGPQLIPHLKYYVRVYCSKDA